MGEAARTGQVVGVSPRLAARIAGGFYGLTVASSLYAFLFAGGTHAGQAANLVAGASYIVVTWLLYHLLAPVNRSVSMLAAFFGLVGISHADNAIFYFGFYCILLGYLVFRSEFLPRIFGPLLVLAGLGLLTNVLSALLTPAYTHFLSTVGFSLDGIGEISFALWLLVMGVNGPRWVRQAGVGTGARQKLALE